MGKAKGEIEEKQIWLRKEELSTAQPGVDNDDFKAFLFELGYTLRSNHHGIYFRVAVPKEKKRNSLRQAKQGFSLS